MSLLSAARLKEHRGNTDLLNYYVDEICTLKVEQWYGP